MPSRKTLNEAYYQYTRWREEQAMDSVRMYLHNSLSRNEWSAKEYRNDAERMLRRADRLGLLASSILGRMF